MSKVITKCCPWNQYLLEDSRDYDFNSSVTNLKFLNF